VLGVELNSCHSLLESAGSNAGDEMAGVFCSLDIAETDSILTG